MKGTIVCDLDGVVYLGEVPVAGSAAALARLEEDGYRILLCTNNSWRTRAGIAARVERISGYPARPEQVLSSAAAAARLLAGSARRSYVVGGDGIREALAEAGVEETHRWEEADHVVVGLDLGLTYPRLAGAVQAVRNGAALVATNHDPTYPTAEGLLPGAGSILAAIETGAGAAAVVAGKPHAPMRRLVAERTGGGPVWVVGDRPDTDLAMAHEEGWVSVLVLTGVTRDPATVEPPPDLVVRRLGDLPAALAQYR